MFDLVCTIFGLFVIGLTAVDVFFTVFYPRTGKSVLSLRICQSVWTLFRFISRLAGIRNKAILSYCGPCLLIIIVSVWVWAFTVGFALLFWPALGSGIQASQGTTPTDFATALYYSGFTLTTLGVGDLVPKSGVWRLVSITEAAVGFSVITASLTYLMSVYNALTRRNTFALSLHHCTTDPKNTASMLVALKGYGQFEPALSQLKDISRDLLFLLEAHHDYPILHFFRFEEVYYSLGRMSFVCLDLVTLIKTALDPQVYGSLLTASATIELENSAQALLTQLSESFLASHYLKQPSHPKEWRDYYFESVATLQQHEVETVSDLPQGADHYVQARDRWNHYSMAVTVYMEYDWSNVVQ